MRTRGPAPLPTRLLSFRLVGSLTIIKAGVIFVPVCHVLNIVLMGGGLKAFWESNIRRLACTDCAYVFYENPVVGVAGILLNEQGQMLLGRCCRGKYSILVHSLWLCNYHEGVHEALRRI